LKLFSLSRNERVKKKNDFKKVYSATKILFSSDLLIKSLYTVDLDKQFVGVKIAVAVSSKAGKAVWRNRIKRLIKESYRLNKHALLKKAIEKKICLLIIFSPNKLSKTKNKKVYYKDIYSSVIELINKIEQQI
jgi:ribonuclease P protein component